MEKLHIVLACDHHESESFAAWLTKQGHEAEVGHDTGDYVGGIRTSACESASDTMNGLWEAYCQATEPPEGL